MAWVPRPSSAFSGPRCSRCASVILPTRLVVQFLLRRWPTIRTRLTFQYVSRPGVPRLLVLFRPGEHPALSRTLFYASFILRVFRCAFPSAVLQFPPYSYPSRDRPSLTLFRDADRYEDIDLPSYLPHRREIFRSPMYVLSSSYRGLLFGF